MNPGYIDKNKEMIIKSGEKLGIPLTMFDSDIFEVSLKLNEENPCYMCARMRRGCLYAKAQELGCNKIALGHHFDDVIETTLLSMFYGSEIKTMMPKLHSDNFEGIELIRPLVLVKEEDIIAWKKYKRVTYGTGLGLSIIKSIFVLHKFNYGVKSTKHRGTTFYFEITK